VNFDLRHPAVILAALGAVSAMLGTHFQGFSYEVAPNLGLHMVLTGVWFGLVVAFGVWWWANHAYSAVAMALIATWVGWELAVNVAIQIAEVWLKTVVPSEMSRTYVGGFAAGAVGAFLTWAGTAVYVLKLRQSAVACIATSTGAIFGLLLPWSIQFDSPIILLLPWQAAVAAVLGFALSSRSIADNRSIAP
jgi:hypothetical protein